MAGQITVDLVGNTKQLRRALAGAERNIGGFSKRASRAIRGIATGSAIAAGAAIALGASAVKAHAEVEKGLREVYTLLPQITDEARQKMTEDLRQFSADAVIPLTEATSGLYQAISAGVPTEQVFAFLEVAAQTAHGGVTDLTTAIDGITTATNSWGSEVLSAGEASDLMFTAVRLGKTTIEEISGSLSNVAPLAASLGLGFEDITAALAVMTAQGVPTTQATTQLRGAIADLAKEGTKASSAFEAAAGQSFPDFVKAGGTLQQAFIKMSDRAADLGIGVQNLFGRIEAGSGVLSLTSKTGAAAMIDALTAMENSSGATEAASREMSQSIQYQLDAMGIQWDILKDRIGEAVAQHILPVLTELVEYVNENWDPWAESIRDTIDRMSELGSTLRDLVAPGLERLQDLGVPESLSTGLGILASARIISGLISLGVVLKTGVAAGLTALGASAAASGIGLIVVGLAALAAGFVLAYKNIEPFREFVDNFTDWMISTAWPAIKDFGADVAAVWTDDVVPIFTDVVWPALQEFGADFVDLWNNEVVPAFQEVIWPAFKTFGSNMIGLFQDEVLPVITDVVWPAIKEFGTLVADLFVTIVKPVWALVVEEWEIQKVVVLELLSSLIDFLVGVFTGDWTLAWEGIKAGAKAIFDYLIEAPGRILSSLIDLLAELAPEIIAFGDQVGAWIITGLAILVEWFLDLPFKLLPWIEKGGELIVDAGLWVARQIIIGLAHLVAWFIKLPGRIIEWIREGGLGRILKAAIEVATWFIKGLISLIKWFIELPGNIVDWIKENLPKTLEAGKLLGENIRDGLFDLLANLGPQIAAIINDLVKRALGGVGDIISDAGDIIGGALGFGGARGAIVTRPTLALIGEAGPEALVPLDQAPGARALPRGGSYGGGGGEGLVVIFQGDVYGDEEALIEKLGRAYETYRRRGGQPIEGLFLGDA